MRICLRQWRGWPSLPTFPRKSLPARWARNRARHHFTSTTQPMCSLFWQRSLRLAWGSCHRLPCMCPRQIFPLCRKGRQGSPACPQVCLVSMLARESRSPRQPPLHPRFFYCCRSGLSVVIPPPLLCSTHTKVGVCRALLPVFRLLRCFGGERAEGASVHLKEKVPPQQKMVIIPTKQEGMELSYHMSECVGSYVLAISLSGAMSVSKERNRSFLKIIKGQNQKRPQRYQVPVSLHHWTQRDCCDVVITNQGHRSIHRPA